MRSSYGNRSARAAQVERAGGSFKSCEELSLVPQQSGSDQVCGAGAMLPSWKCTNLATYAAARQQCHDVGARLCTAAELVADEPAWNSARP